jgi:hypothetical protein
MVTLSSLSGTYLGLRERGLFMHVLFDDVAG